MTTETQSHQEPSDKPPPEKVFDIQIDRTHYELTENRLSGADLRNVPTPPISSDRDLFEIIPGRPDKKIDDQDYVKIISGLRFFTAPNTINPGMSGVGNEQTDDWQ